MIKKIGISLLVGLVIMALFTLVTFKSSVIISEPNFASLFSVSSVKHGVPFTYQTVYDNRSGNYGPDVPKNTGLRFWYLIADWLAWSAAAYIILHFVKKLQPDNTRPDHRRTR